MRSSSNPERCSADRIGAAEYELRLWAEGKRVGHVEKRTLVTFDPEGGLLRDRSPIPDHVDV